MKILEATLVVILLKKGIGGGSNVSLLRATPLPIPFIGVTAGNQFKPDVFHITNNVQPDPTYIIHRLRRLLS